MMVLQGAVWRIATGVAMGKSEPFGKQNEAGISEPGEP